MAKLKINIPSDIKKIQKMFKKNGKQLFLVGGAVRDAILGKSPKDFDLATDAKPDEVLAMAKKEGFKTLEVGKSFGVVIIGGHEIATFRKDIGKGRRPDAVDYTDIQGDVKRRDLTINALFYDLDRQEIVDLVGGIEDLKKKQIRTVGKAEERFDEDPLRKLRALRFYGQLAGKVHSETYQALKKDPSLKGVSGERIRDEFVKGLKKAQSEKQYLALADELKMMQYILPGFKIKKPFVDEDDYQLQIAYLIQDNNANEIIKKLNSLKYPTQEAKNIAFLVAMKRFNPEQIFQFKKMQNATTLKDDQIKTWGKLIGKDLSKFVKFKLSVGGNDVPKELKGQEIGTWIKKKEKEKYLSEGTSKAEFNRELKKVNVNPTPDQQKSGNYQKGHVNIQGFDITIENPAGSTRSGIDDNGKEWSVKMKTTYGYFTKTEGKDGDHIDVFIGDNHDSEKIFVIDQMKGRTFDETKTMLGFDTAAQAKKAYMSNYEKGWKGFGKMTETNIEDFKKWLYKGTKQHKPFADYKDTPKPMKELFLRQLELEFLAEAVIGKWRAPDVSMIERAIKNRNYVGIYYEEEEDSNVKSGFRLIEPHVFGTGFVHSLTKEVSHENDDYLRAYVVKNSKKDSRLGKMAGNRKSVSKTNDTPYWRMLKVERIKKWVNLERTFKKGRALYNPQDKNINNIKASV